MTKFKLAKDATLVLASDFPGDAPRNLRLMFQPGGGNQETAPSLRIENTVLGEVIQVTA